MAFPDDAERVHFETSAEWRSWLEANYARPEGVFHVWWRTPTGRPSIPYAEMVEIALCFGWVDSRKNQVDEERSEMWFTQRRRGSGWARPNKERIERLTAAGLMHPAGQAVVDEAIADGSWTLLDDVENLVVPPDLAEAFVTYPGAAEHWDAFPRSTKRFALVSIVTAKTPATRARRIEQVAEKTARGERLGP